MHRFIGCLVFWLTFMLFLTGCGSSSGGNPQGTPLALPTGTPHLVIGIPAISPTQKGIPAFTKDDVIAYLKQAGVPHTLSGGMDFTIVNIDFILSKVASARLQGESIGVPDEAMVCYAELAGNFVFPGPDNKSGKFSKAVEIFDAQTGNLLLSGGLLG